MFDVSGFIGCAWSLESSCLLCNLFEDYFVVLLLVVVQNNEFVLSKQLFLKNIGYC